MSVPTYRRKMSKAEFLNVADKLEDYTLTHCLTMPKRYKDYLLVKTYDSASEVMIYLIKGNSIKAKIEQDKLDRIHFFNLAKGSLNALQNYVYRLQRRITHTEKNKKISENVWLQWGQLIDEENRLLEGLLKSEYEGVS